MLEIGADLVYNDIRKTDVAPCHPTGNSGIFGRKLIFSKDDLEMVKSLRMK